MNKLKLGLSRSWVYLYFLIYVPWFFLLEQRDPAQAIIIQTDFDRMIPFCEYFIVPYLLWFAYMAVGLTWLTMNTSRSEFYRTIGLLFGGLTFCLVLYTLFFTGLNLRPHILYKQNVFTMLVKRLWQADTSTNVCPSIHVFGTMVVHCALTRAGLWERRPLVYQSSAALAVLIVLSTMFLKQHSVIDVACAFLLLQVMTMLIFGAMPQYFPARRRLELQRV